MSNYNWGSLKEELRLCLMDFERKLRPGTEKQSFLLWKWISWVRSCKRQAIEQNGSKLNKLVFKKKMLEIGMKRTREMRDWAQGILGGVCEDSKG